MNYSIRLETAILRKWQAMMARCYGNSNNAWTKEAYGNCSVVKEWHNFENFRLWCQDKDVLGNHLDKDILFPGNKVYGPDTCCFVPPSINNIVSKYPKGKYPSGVSITPSNKYTAKIMINGENIRLGTFDTIKEASAAYNKMKKVKLKHIALHQEDELIKNGLLRHAELLNCNGDI